MTRLSFQAAFYAAISTGESVTYAQGGSGAQADLTDGTVYYLIKSGTSNRIRLQQVPQMQMLELRLL